LRQPGSYLGLDLTMRLRGRRGDGVWHRRDAVAALTRDAARSPEHLVLLGRVER
jgi:hypothetical protein